MVMSSWWDSAWQQATQDNGETEDERRAREAAQAAPPPPSPVAGFLGSQMAQPPPAPTPPPVGINPIQGGFRQTELQPDPNATTDNPFALPFGAFNAAREATYIPYVTPAIESAKPYIADVINGPGSPLSGLNFASQQLGGPNVGETIADQTPSYGLDFGLNALGAKSFPEALVGVPLGEARGAIGNVATRGLEGFNPGSFDALGGREAAAVQLDRFPSLAGAAEPPINPLGGENVFGPGSRGGSLPVPQGSGSLEDQLRASLEARGVNLPPELRAPPAFPSSYPSIPEGTMGSEFPWATNMQEAGRGGTLPSQEQIDALIRAGVKPESAAAPVRSLPIDPNSPAARMGAPLAYDPQYIWTPENAAADAAMRDLGLAPPAPVDNLARPDMAQELSARMEGGGLPAEARADGASPPPSSLTPEVSDLNRVPELNPEGTGQKIIQDAVANTPDLTPAQKEFLLSPNGQAATLQRDAALNAGVKPGETRTVAAGGVGGEIPPSGTGAAGRGAASGGGQSLPSKLYNGMMEVLYAPFGGDLSSWLRQADTRTLNPLRINETIQSAKVTAQAIGSDEAAHAILQGQKDRVAALGVKDAHFADWNGSLLDRETMTSKALNAVPGYEPLNRGYATSINERRVLALEGFAKTNSKVTPAQMQTFWNYIERATGRGSFGALDNAASKLGPLFTSLRFAASWPQRAASVLPWTRLSDGSVEMFGPVWREAVKDHAGFIATGLSAMALAQQAGLKVDTDKGEIIAGKQHINLWGGGSQYVTAVKDLITGQKNGKDYPAFLAAPKDSLLSGILPDSGDGKYKGTIGEFIRNKAGPLPESIAAAMKISGAAKALGVEKEIKFLRPDYWDKGVTGKNLGALDRAAQFVTFLWVQDVAKAIMAEGGPDNKITPEGLKAGAVAAPVSILGGGVQTYTPDKLTDVREAVKNDTRLPEAVRGVDYKDLGPDGKAAVDALAKSEYPDQAKQGEADRKENANPVFQRYHETTAKIQQTVDERSTKLYDALREGRITGEQLRQGREIINSSAKAQRDAARNDPEYKKALSELDKNEVSKALDVYYSIWETTPKLPDGKPDYDKIEARQAKFLAFADQKDPETAKLLRFELNTGKDTTNPLEKLYDLAKPMLEKYGNIKDDYARSEAQRNNPREDAFLAMLGYGKTQSPQAAQLLQQMRASLPASNVPVTANAPVRSAVAAPAPAPPPMAPSTSIIPGGREMPAPTGARLPPVAPGEFKSETASPQQRQNFINAMAAPANAYSGATRIPPAVWAAMGASESNWGRAPSVFGIKGVGSAGGADLATHEILGGQRVNMNDQFAAYNNLDDAFHHFIDLTSSGRYANAWQHLQETGDWQGFLRGITDAGYATAKNWPDSIISLANHIEKNYPEINGVRR